MALTRVYVEFDPRDYLDQVREAVEQVLEEGAQQTAEDAKRNLERWAPGSTGTLASQIEVKKSKFEDGGWLVEAQGTGNYDIVQRKTPVLRLNPNKKSYHLLKTRNRYYASFVELGTRKMEGLGYLRKALKRNRYRMRKLLKRVLVEGWTI